MMKRSPHVRDGDDIVPMIILMKTVILLQKGILNYLPQSCLKPPFNTLIVFLQVKRMQFQTLEFLVFNKLPYICNNKIA